MVNVELSQFNREKLHKEKENTNISYNSDTYTTDFKPPIQAFKIKTAPPVVIAQEGIGVNQIVADPNNIIPGKFHFFDNVNKVDTFINVDEVYWNDGVTERKLALKSDMYWREVSGIDFSTRTSSVNIPEGTKEILAFVYPSDAPIIAYMNQGIFRPVYLICNNRPFNKSVNFKRHVAAIYNPTDKILSIYSGIIGRLFIR